MPYLEQAPREQSLSYSTASREKEQLAFSDAAESAESSLVGQ